MDLKRSIPCDGDDSFCVPVFKKVCLEANVPSPQHGSCDEPASRSPPSTQSLHDAPHTTTSFTTRSTSKRPKKYLCEYNGCDKAFDRPVRLEAHVRTHTNERPFVCDEEGCTKSFFKSEHLKAHIQNKHSTEAKFVCPYIIKTNDHGEELQCAKVFTTSTRLRRHEAIHEKAEELTCREVGCGQVFRKMDTLQRHIKQEHLHEKAFRCVKIVADNSCEKDGEECGQAFSTANQLRAHENREHARVRYSCSVCSPPQNGMLDEQFGFSTYGEYQAHLKMIHPPTCNLCSRMCDSNRALTAHMEIEHSSLESRQAKYRCDYPGCGRGFTRKGNLGVHVQSVHIKQRNFVCGTTELNSNEKCPGWDDSNGCGSMFTTKASLENHIRTQHLSLPNLYHPRKSTKPKKMENEPIEVDGAYSTSEDQFADMPQAEYDALGLLTGCNYADIRPIACLMPDCMVRFVRNYDLVQHVELAHGWTVDDVYDSLAERDHVQEQQAWTEATNLDFLADDVLEESRLTFPLSQALDFNTYGTLDNSRTVHGEGSLQTHALAHSYANVALDPMLA